MCVVAMAAIWGWRFFSLTAPDRAVSIWGWHLLKNTACPTGSQIWAHPLVFELTIVRVLQPANPCPDWKLPTVPEKEPLQGEWSICCAFFGNKKDKWLTQCWPRASTARHNSGHVVLPEGRLTRTTPYPNLFASGKPIFEMVAPTDNMWQKSDFQVISH